jgi:hypothetical protein
MSAFYEYNNPAYCEGKSPLAIKDLIASGSRLEIGNCLSSLFMMAFAIWGLYGTGKKQDILSRLLWASLFYTGIGSAIYHGTANSAFASLDGLPMIMILCFGLVALFDEIAHENSKGAAQNYIKSTLAIIFMGFFLVSIMGEQYAKGTVFFRVCFGVPLAVIALTLIFLYVKIETSYDVYAFGNSSTKKILRELIVRGWVSGILGFLFWLLDLLLCTQSHYVLLFGHWLWHILIGYFALCLITLLNFLRANNQGLLPVLDFHFYRMIPISYYA